MPDTSKDTQMKKLLIALIASSPLLALASPPLCPIYEYAELQSYSGDTLVAMADDFSKVVVTVNQTIRPSLSEVAEAKNCMAQFERIVRIVEAKNRAESAASTKQ